ncbi:MAG: FAD-binding protein [Pseudomonas profundi]
MNNKKDKTETSLSRRSLLASAGIAVGAAAALGVPGVAMAASSAGRKVQWDLETDVICVGTGSAACTAAVTAVSRGAKVIVLEKMPMAGGTTGKSGGITWIPNNQFLAEAGLNDDKTDCLKYIARYAYPERYNANGPTLGLSEHDYRMIETFYDNGTRMVDWMAKVEAMSFQPFQLWELEITPPDYGDHLAENKLNKGRALEPAVGAGPYSGGSSLAYQLETWLRNAEVPVMLEHKAEEIIFDGERATGLVVSHAGKRINIKANKGVIFGTGGYAHNTDLIERHQSPGLYGSCAAVGSTGDFVGMAQQAGARMGRLDTAWRTPVVLEEALQNRAVAHGVVFAPGDSMIHVNKYGQRCVNEKRNYNDRTQAHFTFDPVNAEYPNLFMFMVFDERTLQRNGGALPIPVDKRESAWLIEGRGTKDLGQQIRQRLQSLHGKLGTYKLDDAFEENLSATITRYNEFARTGRDEDFDRGLHEYDQIWQKVFSPVREAAIFPITITRTPPCIRSMTIGCMPSFLHRVRWIPAVVRRSMSMARFWAQTVSRSKGSTERVTAWLPRSAQPTLAQAAPLVWL